MEFMIISEYVSVKWNSKNKSYYVNKNYTYTKMGDSFEVKIEDLLKGSNYDIVVKCDYCDTTTKISYYEYNVNFNNGGKYACSLKCSRDKKLKTNFEKYNVEFPSQNENIKNKIKQTNLEKYGVENPFQNEDIKDKIKQTNLEKFGFEYASQNDDIKNKKIETSLKNYGVEYHLQTNEIKDKIVQTNLERYGVKYGVQSDNIKDKIKQTNLEKYGFENPSQNINIIEKIIKTKIEKYGEVFIHFVPSYNQKSIIYLDQISEKLNIPIQHALNSGEKKFVRYHIDGYIEQYNICIEWDEPHHNNKKQKEKDLIREQYLIENHECKIVRINEKEFLKNSEFNLLKITNEILNIINLN
jgi:hypothetical protein